MMLDDPRLTGPHAALTAICHAVEVMNSPLVTGGSTTRSANAPSSKPPGRQQCPAAVRALQRILTKAAEDARVVYDNATPHIHIETEADSYGGIETELADVLPAALRHRNLLTRRAEAGSLSIATDQQ